MHEVSLGRTPAWSLIRQLAQYGALLGTHSGVGMAIIIPVPDGANAEALARHLQRIATTWAGTGDDCPYAARQGGCVFASCWSWGQDWAECPVGRDTGQAQVAE